MYKNKLWFTLVELIVVVTILAILSTIGFVSYSGYLAWVRDTNRIAQLKAIWDALHLYSTNKSLPLPDNKVDIKIWSIWNESIISWQGDAWKDVIDTIGYTTEGVDPKDKEYFWYYLSRDKKLFQLMAFLEEDNSSSVFSNSIKNSNAIEYDERYIYVDWDNLWILTWTWNVPVNKIDSLELNGLNIENTMDIYNANLKNNQSITGSGSKLAVIPALILNKWKSFTCKSIKESWIDTDWIYEVYIWGSAVSVYCDMTTDWGWWTLIDGVSSNFWQLISYVWWWIPNINNYHMETVNLYWLLNSNDEKNTFKYKITRGSEDINLNIEVIDVASYIKNENYRDDNLSNKIYSNSWVTINWWNIIQNKKSNSYTRIVLRWQDLTNNFGHLKTYSESFWPHSWWLISDWRFGGLYLNKSLLNVDNTVLPTFWWLFDWADDWNRYSLNVWTENYWSGDVSLLNKGIEAWLWVK